MAEAIRERPTGAENVIWDLSIFYSSLDDPKIETDIAKLNELIDAFQERWRGQVAPDERRRFRPSLRRAGSDL